MNPRNPPAFSFNTKAHTPCVSFQTHRVPRPPIYSQDTQLHEDAVVKTVLSACTGLNSLGPQMGTSLRDSSSHSTQLQKVQPPQTLQGSTGAVDVLSYAILCSLLPHLAFCPYCCSALYPPTACFATAYSQPPSS